MGPFVMVICAAIILWLVNVWRLDIEDVRGWMK